MACQAESSEMNIAMPRGDIRDFPFVVKQKINGEMVLYTGDFDDIYFTVKTNFTEKEYVFQKRLSNGSIVKDQDSVYHVVIEPQDTNNLTFGKYVYDIELINGSTVKQTTTGKLLLNYESTYAINEVSAL